MGRGGGVGGGEEIRGERGDGVQVTTQPATGTVTGSVHAPLLFLFTIPCLREACSPAIHAAPRLGVGRRAGGEGGLAMTHTPSLWWRAAF